MKTFLVIKADTFDWLQAVFPDRSPLLASVCNKPLLEYLLDFAILCGSRHVRLATDMPLAEVEAVFGNGGRWGVELTYAPVRETDDLAAALLKNSRYCAGSRLLVMQGCFFLHYDQNKDYASFMQTAAPGKLLTCATGRILIQDQVPQPSLPMDVPPPPLALTPIRSAGDLYRLSMRVLDRDAHLYVLPGYNNETDVYIGRNVMIARSARIEPPVMIGDNVQIHKNAVVGPNAVIGRNVIIDAHSRVQHSVILDKTYVGEHLVLDRKLAGGCRLVDPGKGTMVQLEDAHLLSTVQPLSRGRNWFQRLGHGLLAALLWVVLAMPYAALSFILKRQGRWRRSEETYWADHNGRTIRLAGVSFNPSGLCGRIAASLALDRYPLLGRVMRGDLALIGTRLLPATETNRAILAADNSYYPGLFSYAEAEPWPVPESDQDIVNRYHLAHRNLWYDWGMMVKILFNKLHEESVLCESISK
ncbi:MAG: NDP-sugar synthase [Desulfobacterales bacterium]|nr:NDP-sugar synthase [Desulfobacterales bacterium]